jgi:hypothetical protein
MSGETFPCNDCGTPIRLHGIYPKETDDRTHDDRRCMTLVKAQRDEARAEVARLTPKPVVYCTRCPFAMHLHPTPPEAGGCPGYP